jgi:hypothetical protein
LGGLNPIAQWQVLEFAQEIYPLVEKHLAVQNDLMPKAQTFKFMVEQKSAALNFQHGDTYLSPSRSTAVRYAVNKRYGSELLTYALDFLTELIRLKIAWVSDNLYGAYPHIFGKLDISPAPLLIQADNLDLTALAGEGGGDAGLSLKRIYEAIRDSRDMCDVLLQQTNFRLRRAISAAELKIWFVDVIHWDPFRPEYALYSL